MKIPHLLVALVASLPFGLHADPVAPNYREELLSADEAFSAKAGRDGVLSAFMSLATADTKVLSENGKGFDAVKSGYKDFPPTATLSWKPSYAEASLAGDLGYTWGRYEYRNRKADGKPVVETGTYVTVWRRQPDGSWKVVLDGGTADPKVP